MRYLFSVSHPAHVHLFKHLIWELEKNGHEVLILAREKDVTIQLMENYHLKYVLLGTASTTIPGYVKETLSRIYHCLRIIHTFHPNMVISQMDPSLAIPSKILRVPYICLADSEPAKLMLNITMPFVDKVYTPKSFRTKLGTKQITYNGYKECAYLHPNWFSPDNSVLEQLGIKDGEKYIVVRFVAWQAHHDVGKHGIEDKMKIIQHLEKFGRVFVTSEKNIEEQLLPYQITVDPTKIHDILYYATLLVTDSQTMTTEAALLGTPVIRYNSFVGEDDMGNFIELQKKYGLIFNLSKEEDIFDLSSELLSNIDLKRIWKEKKNTLWKEKIDLTKYLLAEILD